MDQQKYCKDCKFSKFHYSDGHILKDWSGKFEGDPNDLPVASEDSKYWMYWECSKNSKGLKFINIMNDCSAYTTK